MRGSPSCPTKGRRAATSTSAAPAGSASAFDASSSGGAYPVARYDWSFGDGTSTSNAGAKPTHVYGAPGTYPVSVHLTDTAGCYGQDVFTGRVTYCNLDPAASASALVTVPSAAAGAPPKPVVSGARQSRSRWRKGNGLARISRSSKVPVGTTFTFSLNEPAAVRFTFTTRLPGRRVGRKCVARTRSNRHRKACTRTVGAGVLRSLVTAASTRPLPGACLVLEGAQARDVHAHDHGYERGRREVCARGVALRDRR